MVTVAPDPPTPELRHSSKRLRWPLWLGLAGVVLVTIAVPILHRQLKSRVDASMAKLFHDNLERLKAGQTKSLLLLTTNDTDSLLKEIREMPEVESVCFEHTDLTDNGMRHVATLPRLRHIQLYDAGRISDRGLVALHGCRTLEGIELYGTAVTDDGVAELQRSLPGVKVSR